MTTPSQQGTSSTGGVLGGTPAAPTGVASVPTALSNQRLDATWPTLSPPPMKTLIYAPDVNAYVVHNGIQYDLSADIVRGWCSRKENSASSLMLTLANNGLRYNANLGSPVLGRMDRITLYLTRVTKIQVFSGYLDTVPYFQAYPGTIDIRATCTLKRLLHTWWNPALPESQQFFDQLGASLGTNGDGQGGAVSDSGIGSLLRSVLQQVGGWTQQSVHIQNFPQELITFLNNYMAETNLQAYNANLNQQFQSMILGSDTSPGPMGAVGYSAGDPVGTAATATNNGPQFYLSQIVTAVDQRGMGPIVDNTANSQQVQQSAGTLQNAPQTANQYDAALAADVAQAGQTLAQYTSNWSTQNNASDAAILAVACAMVESGAAMTLDANNSVPESLSYWHDGLQLTGTGCGLFNQPNNGAWGCLPGDAKVFTSMGPVDIVDVREGDEVWSFDGRGMKLAKVTGHVMTGHKPLLTIRTAARELRVTSNHRIPVRRYFGVLDGRRYGNQFVASTCGWETAELSAGEIRPGDYLIVPHGMGDGTARTTPNGDELTVGLMELVGLYLGDGSLDKGRTEIAHGQGRDEDHMPYYRTVIERELGVVPYTDERGTRTRFSSPWFRELITTWFGRTASTKALPGWVFRLSTDLQLALLRGYLDSDGSVDKLGRISWLSVSRQLAEGIRHLCIQVGVPVGKIGIRRAKTTVIRGEKTKAKEAYSVKATSTRHNHRIGSNSPHKAVNFAVEAKSLKSRYDDDWNSSVCRRSPMGAPPKGTVYHRVTGIDRGTLKVPVYDIEVAGLAHYVADGIVVHNTVAQRMNPLSSAGMFLDALNAKTGWRNMDPGQAIWLVQQSDSSKIPQYTAAIQAATTMVQAYRKATQGAANAISGALGAIPGASTVLGGGANPVSNVAGVLAGAATTSPVSTAAGALNAGGPVPNSEGAINAATSMIGTPYVYGGMNPSSGIDCSRMVELAFLAGTGIDVTRTTDSQRSAIPSVPISSIQRGDVLQTNYGGHTGIYLGGGTWIQTGGPGAMPGPQPVPMGAGGLMWAGRVCANGGVNPAAPFSPIAGVVGTTSAGSVPGTGTAPGAGTGSTTGGSTDEPIARNIFSYIFNPGAYADSFAQLFTGEKAYIDCQPLMQMVVALCSASMRNFQSAPNGDFMAYYPDPFGMDGKPAILALEDIELKDCHIDLSDDPLTTHVYIEGDYTMMGQADQVSGWLLTSGVATVQNQYLYKRLISAAPGDMDENMSAQQLMNKFGVRPYKNSYEIAGNAGLEFLLACQVFMGKWAAQYSTDIGLTFMPELYPGMRILLVGHNLTVYVSQVTHEFDWQRGFTTTATVSAAGKPNAASNIYSSLPGFLNPVSTDPTGGGNTSNTGQPVTQPYAAPIPGGLLDQSG